MYLCMYAADHLTFFVCSCYFFAFLWREEVNVFVLFCFFTEAFWFVCHCSLSLKVFSSKSAHLKLETKTG